MVDQFYPVDFNVCEKIGHDRLLNKFILIEYSWLETIWVESS